MAGRTQRARKPISHPTHPIAVCSALLLLEEFVRTPGMLKVDRDKGIIFHVKIIGPESANGNRYTTEALRRAVPLYEGRVVNVDHPAKPNERRSAYDRLGKFQNVAPEADGLYGDLVLLKTHPLAERLMEAAEKMPDVFGMSHNAEGKGRRDADGVFVVEEIVEVRSVDLVADPATTKGLAESKQGKPYPRGFKMAKKLVRDVFEELLPKLPAKSQPRLKSFLEMDDMAKCEAEMDAPDAATTPEDALKSGFDAAIMAVLDDDSMDAAGKIKKIGALLKTHEKLSASTDDAGSEDTTTTEEDDSAESADDKKKATTESRQTKSGKSSIETELRQLRERAELADLKEFVRDECQRQEVLWDKSLEEGLVAMRDRPKITKHLEYLKKVKVRSGKVGTVRSQSPGTTQQSTTEGKGSPPKNTELAAWLRN